MVDAMSDVRLIALPSPDCDQSWCPRCRSPRPQLAEITRPGDRKQRFIFAECHFCARPCCPFCQSTLEGGKCWNVDCFMVAQIIPIPEMVEGDYWRRHPRRTTA